MTDIIQSWINNEIRLTTTIQNIDKEFSNGYYYAEIFNKFKLIPSLDKFYNSTDKKEIDHNFMLLDKTFKDLNIRLNPEEFTKLKKGEKNKNKKILYLIKMQLAKKEIKFENILLKNSQLLHNEYKNLNFPSISKKALVQNIHQNINIKEKTKDIALPEIKNSTSSTNFDQLKYNNNIKSDIKNNDQQLQQEKLERKMKVNEQEKNYHLRNAEKDSLGLENFQNNMIKMKNWEITNIFRIIKKQSY